MSSMFPQLGASSNARSTVPLLMVACLCGFGVVSLILELARHSQQYRSGTIIAGTLGQLAAMIGVVPQLACFLVHSARTRPD